MWCIRMFPSRSGLFISVSIFLKALCTYSDVFILLGYLVHNIWYQSKMVPGIANFFLERVQAIKFNLGREDRLRNIV